MLELLINHAGVALFCRSASGNLNLVRCWIWKAVTREDVGALFKGAQAPAFVIITSVPSEKNWSTVGFRIERQKERKRKRR